MGKLTVSWRVIVVILIVLVLNHTMQSSLSASPLNQLDNLQIFLPLITRVPCASTVAPGPFGVQMFGNTTNASRYFSFLKPSGAQWVRVRMPWSSIEPVQSSPSQYRWDVADSIIGAASEGCVNLVVTHDDAPSWAATYIGGPIDKVSIDAFTEYIGALVERYDGDGIDDAPGSPTVSYWEFYNEPDTAPSPAGNRWGDVGGKYAQMLAAVYPVVKAANPNAQVVFGGIAYDWFTDQGGPFQRSFLDDVLTAGGGNSFDVMNFHAYPPLASNWTTKGGPGLYEKALAIRSKLKTYGLNKPIVITETGDHNNPYPPLPGSDETQTRHVVKLYTQSLAAGIQFTIWFLLYDIGEDYAFNSGLVTNDNPPVAKPAYFVYQTAVKELSNVQFDRVLTETETKATDMEAYHFTDSTNQQSLFVAWLNPINASGQKPLTLSATQVTVRDMFGQTQVVNDQADGKQDGRVTVQISGRPVYLEVKN